MNMNSYNLLMDLVILGAGVYVLYSWLQMKRTGEIMGGMLMPKDLNLKKCRDTAGFLKEMLPKLLLTGLVTLASGVIGVLRDQGIPVPSVIYWASYIAVFAALIGYAVYLKKLIAKYWDGSTKKRK